MSFLEEFLKIEEEIGNGARISMYTDDHGVIMEAKWELPVKRVYVHQSIFPYDHIEDAMFNMVDLFKHRAIKSYNQMKENPDE